ncbi:cytochrome P450 [Daedaleopsis nitida]|nr:cytochrome P450 [Daedaleopsis nitida]
MYSPLHFISRLENYVPVQRGWILDVVFASVVVIALVVLKRSRTLGAPGPSGIPLIGVALQIPDDKQWLKFHEWILQYGDVVGTSVMGQPTLILGSYRAANDLLDTRGAIYSDRPEAVMAGELIGWDRGLGYAHGPDNPRFKEFRRLVQQFIGPRACQDAHILAMQQEETHKLMLRLLRDPGNFYRHPRESTGALILRLAYGYTLAEDLEQDPLVKVVEIAMHGFAKASEPGAFWVDYFPLLRYVPGWLLPGGGYKAVARRMRRELDEMYDLPYAFVKQQMLIPNCRYAQEAEKAAPSFTSTYLDTKLEPTPADEELIKAAAASLYSGGADTTPSSMTAFILAMTLWPDIQARAQAELDSVLGPSCTRLPTFSDRARLPYVNAIVLEVLRWNPAVPLGLAHRVTQDDAYRGYSIPKGTVVWANIWSLLHDPAVFPEPDRFRPERYLTDGGMLRELERHEDPAVIGFGFGRRICPGMFFAMNSIFIGIATMLYVFDIGRCKDGNGDDVVPEVDFRGFISHPVPFECNIAPRSEQAAELVRRAVAMR